MFFFLESELMSSLRTYRGDSFTLIPIQLAGERAKGKTK